MRVLLEMSHSGRGEMSRNGCFQAQATAGGERGGGGEFTLDASVHRVGSETAVSQCSEAGARGLHERSDPAGTEPELA